jgi:hypothetical protein
MKELWNGCVKQIKSRNSKLNKQLNNQFWEGFWEVVSKSFSKRTLKAGSQ